MSKLKIISTLHGGRILSLHFEKNSEIGESIHDESVVSSIVIEVSNPLFLFLRCKKHWETTKKRLYK